MNPGSNDFYPMETAPRDGRQVLLRLADPVTTYKYQTAVYAGPRKEWVMSNVNGAVHFLRESQVNGWRFLPYTEEEYAAQVVQSGTKH